MGSNKHLQRGSSSYPKTGELTHLWKHSSPFTAYLALMPLPSGKMDFNQVVLQTNLHLQRGALWVSCNTQQDGPARSKSDHLHSVSSTQPPLLRHPLSREQSRRARGLGGSPVLHRLVTTACPEAIAQDQLETLVNENAGTPRMTNVTFGNSN